MLNRRTFCAAAAGALSLRAQDGKPTEIKIDDLKNKVDRGEKLFYLDVREPKELEELGTLKEFVNIPLGQVESRLSEIPKDRPIVVYWNAGKRAARAAEILAKHGYKTVQYCGLREWREKNYPLVYPKAK